MGTKLLPDLSGNPLGSEPIRILIVDDERFHAEAVAETLERVGYECQVAASGAAGAKRIEAEDWDVILTDLRMSDLDGLAVLRKAKQACPEAEVVVITGQGDVKSAVQAMTEGAFTYLTKPVEMAELRAIVARAAEKPRMLKTQRELQRQLHEKFGFEGVIGNSPRMHKIIDRLKSIAGTSATVLIRGETGTGKELVARAIHTNSPRRNKKFVAMNCTALNENLLDDELFGHEPGAFTGGDRLRKGRFEDANGGTLFLDEVGDMPLALQAKLLRVLENQEVFRIGSNEAIKVNVRLLSATNRDLEAAVAAGSFRQDLYFRLKVVTVDLPPLRERREDIPLLTAHFLKDFNQRHSKNVATVAEPVRKAMLAYDWPGNVREMRNAVESMVVQDQDGVLTWEDLQEGDVLGRLRGPGGSRPTNLAGRPLSEVQRYYVEETLEMTGGNRVEAARLLGIGERTLYRMMQDYKLQDEIRQALDSTGGDVEAAAKTLEMTPAVLQRKLKRLGLVPSAEDEEEE